MEEKNNSVCVNCGDGFIASEGCKNENCTTEENHACADDTCEMFPSCALQPCAKCGKLLNLDTEAFYPHTPKEEDFNDEDGNIDQDEFSRAWHETDNIDTPYCEQCAVVVALEIDAEKKARLAYINK